MQAHAAATVKAITSDTAVSNVRFFCAVVVLLAAAIAVFLSMLLSPASTLLFML